MSPQATRALFRRLRFNAFVLQSGFNTGAFMVMASASASLMTELLHRPATEFGLYFMLFPVGFFTGNFISTRIGNRVSTETMVLAGSLLAMATVGAQALVLSSGCVTPLAFFIPGFFITMAQGIAHALRAGRRDGGNPALRRHRGRHRRVHAELLRRGVRASSTGFSPTARRAR